MEQFIVSARKYRPQNFEDVVGQKAITDTLKKAIANNHLAQSLLFTGPRGVGKTTCARILAKKINEKESGEQHQDFAFNIFELDAASNNTVDDIRKLNEQVRIPPQVGKYKVYIIDEVHMLSQSAFNAFLKTLEEPQKHVIFILATTEKHKIIPTILSRCQIFDFSRISVTDIKNHLKHVAEEENVEADDDALHIIAEHADGALRDALSTFDRVVSFCGNQLTREEISESLNILDFKTYFEMTDYLYQQDMKNALLLLDKLLAKGFDGHHFISGLTSHFRDILVAKNQDTVKLLEVSDEAKREYIRQAKSLSTDFLIKSINITNECDYKYKSSYNQRISLELALMNVIHSQKNGADSSEKKNLNQKVEEKNGYNEQKENQPISKPEIKAPSLSDDDKVENPQNQTKQSGTSSTSNSTETENQQDQSGEKSTELESKNSSTQEENQSEMKSQQTPSAENVVNEPTENQKLKKSVPGLSLKSIRQKKAVQSAHAKNSLPEQEMVEPFTEDQVFNYWKNYTQAVKDAGKRNLSAVLKACQLDVQDKKLMVVLPAQGMKEDLQREQDKLLNYLKKSLKNTHISLHISVKKSEEKSIVTTKEKYNKLLEINPKVEVLRQKFNLEL